MTVATIAPITYSTFVETFRPTNRRVAGAIVHRNNIGSYAVVIDGVMFRVSEPKRGSWDVVREGGAVVIEAARTFGDALNALDDRIAGRRSRGLDVA